LLQVAVAVVTSTHLEQVLEDIGLLFLEICQEEILS
jgi:hypothetical protein